MALTDNIISYWKLDESSGNAADSAGSNTATASNLTYSTGKINNAAVFNNSNSSLTVSDNSTLEPADAITVTAWFNLAGTPNLEAIICKNYTGTWSAPYASYLIRVNSATQIGFYMNIGGTLRSKEETVSSLSTSTWYFVAMTYDRTNFITYLNGSQLSSTNYNDTLRYSTGNLTIGTNVVPEVFNGSIDEVGLWSRALSSTEISQLYNSGSGLQYPFGVAGNIKKINNIAWANVKKVNNIAVANIKKINNITA